MMCGSSFKNKGVQTALDAVCRYLPSPVDIEDTTGIDPNTGETIHSRNHGKHILVWQLDILHLFQIIHSIQGNLTTFMKWLNPLIRELSFSIVVVMGIT